ncbi:MAG: hypothetical protein K2O15_06915 [Lachnospiraceae bacterium]|nr:hypothetical protein [Lachnospiraceae bacterium]
MALDITQNTHDDEGDFIKIYTKSLADLPDTLTVAAFRFLIELAVHMSYADINDPHGGMLVQINAQNREEIQSRLNIKKAMFYRHLKTLEAHSLIKEVKKSCYQINPNLLGKGYFEYRPMYRQGGIKALRDSWKDTDDFFEDDEWLDNLNPSEESIPDDDDITDEPEFPHLKIYKNIGLKEK